MDPTKPETRTIHFAGRDFAVPYRDEHRRGAPTKAKAESEALASMVPVAAAFAAEEARA